MWKLLEGRRNREIIGWLASGAAALAAGTWAVYVHFTPLDPGKSVAAINADCSLVVGGNIDTKGNISIGNCADKRDR